MSFNIRLTSEEWSKLNALLKEGPVNKIAAIKLVRDAKLHHTVDPVTGHTRPGVGLKAAKEAVEHYMSSRGI